MNSAQSNGMMLDSSLDCSDMDNVEIIEPEHEIILIDSDEENINDKPDLVNASLLLQILQQPKLECREVLQQKSISDKSDSILIDSDEDNIETTDLKNDPSKLQIFDKDQIEYLKKLELKSITEVNITEKSNSILSDSDENSDIENETLTLQKLKRKRRIEHPVKLKQKNVAENNITEKLDVILIDSDEESSEISDFEESLKLHLNDVDEEDFEVSDIENESLKLQKLKCKSEIKRPKKLWQKKFDEINFNAISDSIVIDSDEENFVKSDIENGSLTLEKLKRKSGIGISEKLKQKSIAEENLTEKSDSIVIDSEEENSERADLENDSLKLQLLERKNEIGSPEKLKQKGITEENSKKSDIENESLKLQLLKQKSQKKVKPKSIAERKAMENRKEKALKSMQYLLTQSEKFSNFFSSMLYEDSSHGKPKKKSHKEKNILQPTVEDMEEVVNTSNKKDLKDRVDITTQLKYFEGGKLHPYQIEGVTWMTVLHENGINGILADEMGLGKTIQVIALICHLIEKGIGGPFLIVAPVSTLTNWESEFKRFAPKIPVVLFHGNQYDRIVLKKEINKKYKVDDFRTFPVILASYQYPTMEQKFLNKFEFQYVVVDEGHRIKNHESQLASVLRRLTTANRLLLTGTPLQNNVQELWSLLNFIMPQIFTDMDTFASLIMLQDMEDENKLMEQEEESNVIGTLHKVIAPFMLRRLKKEVLIDMVPKKEVFVYCPLSEMQRKLYMFVIDKNIKALCRTKEKKVTNVYEPRKKRKCVEQKSVNYCIILDSDDDMISDDELFAEYYKDESVDQQLIKANNIKSNEIQYVVRLTMMNRLTMYKKIVNHPYLVHFPLDPNSEKKELLINEDIVNVSGKMMMLDAMLTRLKRRGHKVLIFSTLVMTIDLIEELMIMRDYSYKRLDGGSTLESRTKSIYDFNNDPYILAFLISTRAGGLGLNLTGADTVIFFDRDWNPQADIQAQDRCHRIGQIKPVMVYTLVAKNTIDEVIIDRGRKKRLLEKLVIKDGKFKKLCFDKVIDESDLQELKELLTQEHEKFEEVFSNEELDRLLDRSDLYKNINITC